MAVKFFPATGSNGWAKTGKRGAATGGGGRRKIFPLVTEFRFGNGKTLRTPSNASLAVMSFRAPVYEAAQT
jgi:hypothetical protein